MEITRDLSEQQRRPRFGTANPERMRMEFWEWMVRGDKSAPPPDEWCDDYGYGAWHARNCFGISPDDREGGPIWCFERMGATCEELADGRRVFVAGEHEDWYDPDFCIYNDVVVIGSAGEVEIYGYPREIFPPTDFHTATRVGDSIIVIGGLGYTNDRKPGFTPVYALDLADYLMQPIETSGEMPGWLFKHAAELNPERNVIVVTGGEVCEVHRDRQRFRRNLEDYEYDLDRSTWRRVTDRKWRQFSIRQADVGHLRYDLELEPEALLPKSIEYRVLPHDGWREALIEVQGVPVWYEVDLPEIRIVIRGPLPEDLGATIAEEAQASAEAAIERPCVVEE